VDGLVGTVGLDSAGHEVTDTARLEGGGGLEGFELEVDVAKGDELAIKMARGLEQGGRGGYRMGGKREKSSPSRFTREGCRANTRCLDPGPRGYLVGTHCR
jgi:hypothetical protein